MNHAEFLTALLPPSDGILKDLEAFAAQNHVPIVPPETAALISVLAKMQKPTRILEIGTAIGYSGIILASELKEDGKMITIERYSYYASLARESFERAGLSHKIRLIEGDAEEVLPCLSGEFDLVFMDAAKAQYLQFLNIITPMLSRGGVLIADNVLYKGMTEATSPVLRRKITIVKRLRAYLKAVTSHSQLKTSIIPIGDGLTVSYKL